MQEHRYEGWKPEDHERFHASLSTTDPEEHWFWSGPKNNTVPVFCAARKVRSASILAYDMFVGVPDKRDLSLFAKTLRKCDAQDCINPHHQKLYWSTRKGYRQNASAPSERLCRAGLHDLSQAGARTKDGRQCRACRNARARERPRPDRREPWDVRAAQLLEQF